MHDLRQQGNIKFQVREYSEAIRLYTEALEQDPKDQVLYSNRSAAWAQLGRWDKSSEDAKKCIATNPKFIKGYFRLAQAQMELGQYQAALQTLDKGMYLDPTCKPLAEMLNQLGQLQEQQRKEKENEQCISVFGMDSLAIKKVSNDAKAPSEGKPSTIKQNAAPPAVQPEVSQPPSTGKLAPVASAKPAPVLEVKPVPTEMPVVPAQEARRPIGSKQDFKKLTEWVLLFCEVYCGPDQQEVQVHLEVPVRKVETKVKVVVEEPILSKKLETVRSEAETYRDCLDQELQNLGDANGRDHVEVAAKLADSARMYGAAGDFAKEVEMSNWALRVLEAPNGLDHAMGARMLVDLGLMQPSLSKDKERLSKALRSIEAMNPSDASRWVQTADIGNVYGQIGDSFKHRKYLRQALHALEKCKGENSVAMARILTALGSSYADPGEAERKETYLRRAMELMEAYRGSNTENAAKAMVQLCSTIVGTPVDDIAKRRKLLERAVQINELVHGKDHVEVARALSGLAGTYSEIGDLENKKKLLERAIRITKINCGKDHHEVATLLADLAFVYGDLDDYEKKRELLEQGLAILEANPLFGPDSVEVASFLHDVAMTLGDREKKRELLTRAMGIFETVSGPDSMDVARTLATLGDTYGELGSDANPADIHKQKDLQRRALRIYEKFNEQDTVPGALLKFSLATSLALIGEEQEAFKLAAESQTVLLAELGSNSYPYRHVERFLSKLHKK